MVVAFLNTCFWEMSLATNALWLWNVIAPYHRPSRIEGTESFSLKTFSSISDCNPATQSLRANAFRSVSIHISSSMWIGERGKRIRMEARPLIWQRDIRVGDSSLIATNLPHKTIELWITHQGQFTSFDDIILTEGQHFSRKSDKTRSA